MKHSVRSLISFEEGLGKLSTSHLNDLFLECFAHKKTFNIYHFARHAFSLKKMTVSWYGYVRLLWSLYLKKRSWDMAIPDHLFNAYTLFNTLYTQHHPAQAPIREQYTIPPIVHQIWLGSPLPARYRVWQKTWQDLPGWQYILWTEHDVESLGLSNKTLYDNARNWGERADIMRYEILYRYGGLYVDIDFACLQPAIFEQFHHQYDFYSSLQPLDIMMFCLANGIIGAAPHHPILESMINYLSTNNPSNIMPIWARTGPVPFTHVVYHQVPLSSHTNIVLPPHYFFPRSLLDERMEQAWPPEAAAVHHWVASWKSKQAQVKE